MLENFITTASCTINDSTSIYISLRLRKAGRMWRGGARETREPRVTIR